MSTHQGRKSEIDAKADRFRVVEETAHDLIERKHYASIEIKERMENLKNERDIMDDEWDLHWEELQMSKFLAYKKVSLTPWNNYFYLQYKVLAIFVNYTI